MFLRAAQAQLGFAFRLIVLLIDCVPGVTRSAPFPLGHVIPFRSLHIKLQGIVCNLSESTVRVQMTVATLSLPPAVNSLRLDADNHLPCAALRYRTTLPHGLIATTLSHL